ncbi:hypothetical protein N7490_007434 [Penicillium lividum]|nr:hypothetical protein N7490_007434 [Penicillium lividum]
MSRRYLPFEILVIIFRDLGTEGFRTIKSNGLTICKDWRYMIEPMIYEKLHVTPLGFLNMPAGSLAKVQIYTEWLIILKEITVEDIPLGCDETPAETTNILADRLSELANFLAGCTKLRSFSLHLVGTLAPSSFSNQLLSWSKSLDMLQSSSIERLEIDTFGSGINPGRDFCRNLSAVIPKIRHVSLKMQWICDEIFGFVDTRCQENTPIDAKLELLVINLVSTGNGPTADVLSCPCSGLTVDPEFPLFRHIEEHAKDVSWTFRKIKELWVVYDVWPGRIRAHEVCASRWYEFEWPTYRTKGFDLTDDSWSRFDHEVSEDSCLALAGISWSDSEDPGEYDNNNMSSPQDPDFDDYESDRSSHGR